MKSIFVYRIMAERNFGGFKKGDVITSPIGYSTKLKAEKAGRKNCSESFKYVGVKCLR